jgi:hypothetical protein
LTAGTRRNGTTEFGPYEWAASPQDDEYSYAPYDVTSSFWDADPFGDEETVQLVQPVQADHEGDAAHETELSRDAGRYTGRHASVRGKTARKRVGRVVPVAAVAATLAAGTAAAVGLTSGGQPQAANLNTSLAIHGTVASTPASGAGTANGASAAPIKVATATAGAAYAPKHAKTAPSHAPAATPTAAAAHAAASASAPVRAAQAAAPATPAPAASSSATAKAPAATTLSCNVNSGLLPANVTAIVSFLLAHGYSDNAAAGIAGNIYQESKGEPESEGMGGGGLIGFTPLPAGYVTGNPATDLQTQLSAVLTYNQGWSQYLPALNSAASPSDAAYIYVTDFERAGIPAADTREASAQDVASACGI